MAEIVELSLDDAIRLQDELIKGYMGEDFQRRIWQAFQKAQGDPQKQMIAKVETCQVVQFSVLPSFGFEASRKGVQASLKAFNPLNSLAVVNEKNALMQYLIDPQMQQTVAAKHLPAPRGVPASRVQTPDPSDWPEGSGKVWVVVGGAQTGGIVVRRGEQTKTAELPQRLGTGALVEQLELSGDRLKYQRMDGTGPDIGWVSVSFKGKPLLMPLYFDLDRADTRQPDSDAKDGDLHAEGQHC
mmetsp:Transcript_17351/g.50734  ORF Transcript_17351/g.50734 Transcript_17351/m.50734 type:complete len:242 (-) Transcript_17351:169-894(-)